MRSTICVTVGCNVNGAPHWDGAYVKSALLDTLGPRAETYTLGTVLGEWEGITERTIIWTGTVPRLDRPEILDRLHDLCTLLRQDAIGLIWQDGTDTLYC